MKECRKVKHFNADLTDGRARSKKNKIFTLNWIKGKREKKKRVGSTEGKQRARIRQNVVKYLIYGLHFSPFSVLSLAWIYVRRKRKKSFISRLAPTRKLKLRHGGHETREEKNQLQLLKNTHGGGKFIEYSLPLKLLAEQKKGRRRRRRWNQMRRINFSCSEKTERQKSDARERLLGKSFTFSFSSRSVQFFFCF